MERFPTGRAPIGAGREVEGAEAADAEARLREALAEWASGVTVVAVRDGERVHATTAAAFMGLSLRPPLVAIALGGGAQVLPFLEAGAPFGVSVLAAEQRRWATIFADPFPVGPSPFPAAGVPLIPGALAGLTCTVREWIEAGDHRLVVAAVDAVVRGEHAEALVFFRRGYRSLE